MKFSLKEQHTVLNDGVMPSNLSLESTLVILQPGYLPWLGFFDQMAKSDVFVIYDDVQYDKHGWRNRNRIKSPHGPQWLTVPVHSKSGLSILDVKIDRNKAWSRKHIGSLIQNYKTASFFENYIGRLAEILGEDWEFLVDLDMSLLNQLNKWLGIEKRILRSSETDVTGERNQRLLNFCLEFNAIKYLSGSAARCYLDLELFQKHGIEVTFQDYEHPVYPQLHGEFIPYLSVVDLLMNCGPASLDILTHKAEGTI